VKTNLSYRHIGSFAATLSLVVCGLGPGVAAQAPKPVTHTVTIDGTSFQPPVITVKAGDSVVWGNKDFFPHTATSKAGGLNSPEIQSGKSWKFKAAKKGEFAYVCTLHPTMKATLRVK
jgi:plastocyanin